MTEDASPEESDSGIHPGMFSLHILRFYDIEEEETIKRFSGFSVPTPEEGDTITLSSMDVPENLEEHEPEDDLPEGSYEIEGHYSVKSVRAEYTSVKQGGELYIDTPLVDTLVSVEKVKEDEGE